MDTFVYLSWQPHGLEMPAGRWCGWRHCAAGWAWGRQRSRCCRNWREVWRHLLTLPLPWEWCLWGNASKRTECTSFIFINACDTNIHKCSNRANTRDNQQLKASLHADFSSDLSPVKSKLFSNNTRCGLKRVKTKICVKAGESVSSQMSSALFELHNFRHPVVKFTGKWVRCSNQSNQATEVQIFFSCKLIGLPK